MPESTASTSTVKPSRARNLTRALFDKVKYECDKQGIVLDTYDADFIMAVMLEWLEANDAALTKTGVKRFRR